VEQYGKAHRWLLLFLSRKRRIPVPRLSKSDRKIQQVMNMLKELAEKEKAEKQP
jgi:hypothetical protein